jgi:hypothetical protein
MAYLGIDWSDWKHSMHHYAGAKHVELPKGFSLTTDRCGDPCHLLLKRVQHHAGLAQDGIIGPRTAALLRPWFPDLGRRERLLDVCQWGVDHNGLISYAQIRPMNLGDCVLPITEDCSKYVTFGCYWSACPDPNGLHYSGEGNTSTMYHHLPKVSLGSQHPGDLIIWGGAVIQERSHVVVACGGGTDPEVYSHGSDIGPLKLRLSAEAPYHDGLPMTVHKLF